MTKRIFILFIFIIFLNSCRPLRPAIMFRASRNYKFDKIPSDSISRAQSQYDIMANDIISLKIYTNDGFKLIDIAGNELGMNTANANPIEFTLDPAGNLKLPVVGMVNLVGKTIRQAEIYLEEVYSKYYNKPFIVLNVLSRRVYVFPGNAGSARSVKIINNNTSLIEILTQVGGIQQNGKAYKVRIMRDYNTSTPKIYQIDLSRIENIQLAAIPVQNHDIIYVEPMPQYAQSIGTSIAPYLTLLSTTLLIVGYYKIITK